MLFDWFTVGAQALNFLILVWLMKHFLYKPIINAIDSREKLIEKELSDADAKKNAAQIERNVFQKKNEEFDQQRAALLAKAIDEAKAERLRLIEEARSAADDLSAKHQESLANEAHNLNLTISRMTQKEVFAITRKALKDLATASLEERIGEVFSRRLREMDDKSKYALGEAFHKNPEPALICSAFDLPASQRAAIQTALNETFSADIHIRFETAPDLVCGIELTANGQKVGWNIADYLTALEKSVGNLVKENDKPASKSKSNPAPDTETAPESNKDVKAEGKTKPESDIKPELKAWSNPSDLAKGLSTFSPHILNRVHALYEELGRADVQAVLAWENTERITHEADEEAKNKAKPKADPVIKPDTSIDAKPSANGLNISESKAQPKIEEQHVVP